MQELEDNLPLDAQYRNPKVGALAPMVVVNQVYGAGDGNMGVQTAAYNLPNDERIISQRGSKRVMLKNIQEAKFKSTLTPITKLVLRRPTRRTSISIPSSPTSWRMKSRTAWVRTSPRPTARNRRRART
jgi:hypothetical protein